MGVLERVNSGTSTNLSRFKGSEILNVFHTRLRKIMVGNFAAEQL